MDPEASNPDPDVDELSAEANSEDNEIQVEEIPHGRLLTPTGSIYKMACVELSSMSKQELTNHIQVYRTKVDEAQMALDYRRIRLGMAENEMEHREAEEQRRTRAYKAPYNVGGKVKLPVSINTKRRSSSDIRSTFFAQIDKWRGEGKNDSEIAVLLAAMMKGSR